ncbi:MAG: hypothetical protein WCO12_03550 [bacterium]
MENKTSNFQIIVLVVFGFFVIAGLILFATATVGNKSTAVTPVEVWGTFPSGPISKLVDSINEIQKDTLKLTYVEKDPATFDKELVEALADGSGPDAILLPSDSVIKYKNKIFTIPYTSYPLKTFKDQFVDASSIYLNADGVVAIPFAIDPIVMYWNKSHFINASIVNPPSYWDDFTADVSKLTKKDSNFNIKQSGVALGEYKNIPHSKDILSMLFLQAGLAIAGKGSDGAYVSSLSGNVDGIDHPAESALTFYTDFANPVKSSYSWNRSFSPAFDSFVSGDTSIYFGYASELPSITLKNPNLNFDVSMVPQVRDASRQSVFAKMYGFAIMRSTKNLSSTFAQISKLTEKGSIASSTSFTNLPPVRKDVIDSSPADPYMQVFYNSALRAQLWPDPDPESTKDIFDNMIESVISGKAKVSDIVNGADQQLENVFRQIK